MWQSQIAAVATLDIAERIEEGYAMPESNVISPEVRAAAEGLARANIEAEPGIQEVYWFPAGDAIHLIEIDRTAFANETITPFYFGPDPQGGIPFPSGIALIRPEEKDRLTPPPEWGSWDQAIRLLQRN
jgi:hypothetical protein